MAVGVRAGGIWDEEIATEPGSAACANCFIRLSLSGVCGRLSGVDLVGFFVGGRGAVG